MWVEGSLVGCGLGGGGVLTRTGFLPHAGRETINASKREAGHIREMRTEIVNVVRVVVARFNFACAFRCR